jgi:hypothetical protein
MGRSWEGLRRFRPLWREVKLTFQAGIKSQSMLRDGFLVVAHFKAEIEDEGTAGYSTIDLRSPATGWRRTDLPCHIITFERSIEQSLVATLHTYVI